MTLGVGGVGIASSSGSSAATVVGNGLNRLIRAIAEEVGRFEEFVGTDGGASNAVIASGTIDTEAPASKYGGHYLYAPFGTLAGQQQRIAKRGFAGATGTHTTVGGFSGATPTGQAWWRLGTIPAIQQDGLLGIREAINRAIRKLWTIDRYPFVATEGQKRYDLGALWWARRSRFKRLLAPALNDQGHPYPSDQGWDIRQDGELWYLELNEGFRAGETFWLECEIPTNARLFTSGTWAYTASPTAGMVHPSDACLGEWNALFQCCLYETMEALAVQAGSARKAYWRNEIDKPGGQRDTVAIIKAFDMDGIDLSLGEGKTDAAGTGGGGYGAKSWARFGT